MTIRLTGWPFNRKRERELAEMKAKQEAYAADCSLKQAREPYRPPHPCEHQGHDFQPLHKTPREILLVCLRCAESKRVPVRSPLPAPARPRFAHVA